MAQSIALSLGAANCTFLNHAGYNGAATVTIV